MRNFRDILEVFALGLLKSDAAKDVAMVAFADEERRAEQVMPAGIAFRSPADKAKALVWFRRGNRAAGVALPVHTPLLNPASVAGLSDGDCKVYDEHGNSIHLKTGEVAITADIVRVSKDITSPTGSLELLWKRMIRLETAYQSHAHSSAGAAPPPPLPPIT